MSNPLLKQFKIDNELETEGIVLQYSDTLEIRCARPGGSNKKFGRRFEELSRPYRRAMDNGVLPNDVAETMLHKVYAEAVVLDWKGVTKDVVTGDEADEAEQLPCTVENVIAVFKALPELFNDIRQTLDQRAVWLQKTREHEAKN